MQELAALSDLELAKLENSIKERANSLATLKGKKESEQWVIRLFDYLQNSGYRLPDADKKRMAAAYADQLKDAIIVYGYEQVSYCVREWVKSDTYKTFPNAGMILEKVHELCGNPIAEVARRKHEALVKQMEERNRKELLSKYSDEELEQLRKKYGGRK